MVRIIDLYKKKTGSISRDSLIAEWKLDETSGTTLFDTTGAYNLTHVNDLSTLTTTDAKVGTALNFDGKPSAYGSPINISEGGVNTAFSLSFWFKDDTGNSLNFFMGNGSTPTWDVYTSANILRFKIYKADGSEFITNSIDINPAWTHIAVVVDPATAPYCTIYVNGVDQTSSYTGTYGDARDSVGNFALGGRSDFNNNACYGILDEVKIWRKALTQQEITNIYNSEL